MRGVSIIRTNILGSIVGSPYFVKLPRVCKPLKRHRIVVVSSSEGWGNQNSHVFSRP